MRQGIQDSTTPLETPSAGRVAACCRITTAAAGCARPSPEGFEEAVERLVRSRVDQGLPLHLEDPAALERIAQLLLAAAPGLERSA